MQEIYKAQIAELETAEQESELLTNRAIEKSGDLEYIFDILERERAVKRIARKAISEMIYQ